MKENKLIFKCLLSIIIILLLGCNQKSNDYHQILKGLENNYTVSEIALKKNFILCGGKSERQIKIDSINYVSSVNKFYESDKTLLLFLLKFENDKKRINNWITFSDPCSSIIEKKSFINNSLGAIILFDNFLTNKRKTIIINDYVYKINFNELNKFYDENSRSNLDVMKTHYKVFLKKRFLFVN
jgi:hypothetical protein